jgi:hypothetical protein
MPFLEASAKPDFHLTPEIHEQLLRISPALIDRLLAPNKAVPRGKGVSGARLGEAALLKQIPVEPTLRHRCRTTSQKHRTSGCWNQAAFQSGIKTGRADSSLFSIWFLCNTMSIKPSTSCIGRTGLKLHFLNEAPRGYGVGVGKAQFPGP